MHRRGIQESDEEDETYNDVVPDSPSSCEDSKISKPTPKKRRNMEKRVVSVPIVDVEGSKSRGEVYPPSDSWAWRKYGQKPIKGSPYPSVCVNKSSKERLSLILNACVYEVCVCGEDVELAGSTAGFALTTLGVFLTGDGLKCVTLRLRAPEAIVVLGFGGAFLLPLERPSFFLLAETVSVGFVPLGESGVGPNLLDVGIRSELGGNSIPSVLRCSRTAPRGEVVLSRCEAGLRSCNGIDPSRCDTGILSGVVIICLPFSLWVLAFRAA
ncbi:hypothetical protein F2Q68_00041750 [Brassica cretica]|uniref:WRKY domain-containing protein n=1 Tax=Brassica cretica TaxID=69181 RepID=A0A8S9MD56_BRACR|nr:hypothetical protein F2Q68_00041750 [Brassica cretica]